MRRLPLLVLSLSVSLSFIVAGCGTAKSSARVDDEKLVRLPPPSREAILDKQRDLNIAEGNLTAMQVAQSEAARFKEIVDGELEAARARFESDERGLALAKDAREPSMIDNAERARALGRSRLEAAKAKMNYALRLKELRDAQVAEARAALDLAKARLERVKFEELHANDMSDELRARPFLRAERLAKRRLEERRERAHALEADVETRQRTWQALRAIYDERAKRTGEVPLDAPPPPEPWRRPG